MRLIDADLLVDICKDIAKHEWNKRTSPVSWSDAYEDFIDTIEEMPTILTVAKLGHWEMRPHPYRTFYPEYCCSVCGGWRHGLAYEYENMNYCPNCGAKMDKNKNP